MGVFKSKKFLTAMGGVVAAVLFYFLGIPEQTTMQVVAIIISYIVGQGIADKGKEAEKIKKAE
ncbi:MAG: hypothetical protein COV43_04390 [Deltaproteobacteria bacterium CG11_big_fil_rev_8_21_14_0_20_42_23]|nr:MAG: hypothetical protein COV43_04390 [Deltaproteobacteria bacterium CG11_big_fil_rev_8_21_14_0_20_42_23]PJC65013.1 MAG: hypothetical protein CO021_00780 [Deltaproteobacteria bacterium CG_4_9_14_0_2_um_filter_42_21]